jgi:hypothetical protein
MAAEIVFGIPDLISEIFSHLNFAEISAYGAINKLTHEITSEMYKQKYKTDVEEPCLKEIETYEESQNLLYLFQVLDDNVFAENHHIRCVVKSFENMFNRYWVCMIYNPNKMEQIVKNFLTFVEFTEISIDPNFANYLRENKLVWVEHPSNWTVYELKKFAKFLKIKGYGRMNRSKLLQKLRRPGPNHLYVVKTNPVARQLF